MKKQDILTPIGLVIGTVLVAYGMLLGGTDPKIFFDVASIAITIGGSFAALLITYPLEDLKKTPRFLKVCFTSSNVYKVDLIDQFKEISRRVRKDGVLSLEEYSAEIEDDFLRKGLELVIDGIEPDNVKEILELEIQELETEYSTGSKIFKVWGTYAPAYGMVGTLIGLIQMLVDLGSPETMASGMSKALITTFYGSLLANLALNPIGFNIQIKGEKEVECKEMMLCGIISIQEGDSSRVIEEKLSNFLTTEEKRNYNKRVIQEEGAGGGVA